MRPTARPARSDQAELLAAARRRGPRAAGGDEAAHVAFGRLAEPHRRELLLHCYRMLGSLHDAEDVVQETFLRAWRALPDFEGRSSFRAWLYRIATNACLNALAARKRRILPPDLAPPTDRMPPASPAPDLPWLEPYPDALLAGVPDTAPGPDARYELRESIRLAFVAAIQFLPARQRAALLLCDVLGWPAAEAARLLETTTASVTSALQRARATLKRRLPGTGTRTGTGMQGHTGAPASWATPAAARSRPSPQADEERALLERYVRCWETGDGDAFAALLAQDAVLTMPPWREWYRGRATLARFLAFTHRPGGQGPFRLVRTAANGQPAFAFYSRFGGDEWRAHSIMVLSIEDGRIAEMVSFVGAAYFEAFGLADGADGADGLDG